MGRSSLIKRMAAGVQVGQPIPSRHNHRPEHRARAGCRASPPATGPPPLRTVPRRGPRSAGADGGERSRRLRRRAPGRDDRPARRRCSRSMPSRRLPPAAQALPALAFLATRRAVRDAEGVAVRDVHPTARSAGGLVRALRHRGPAWPSRSARRPRHRRARPVDPRRSLEPAAASGSRCSGSRATRPPG